MLRRFNSLTSRLILIALMSAGLILTLGIVGWGAISTLILINDSISEAEDQENRLLTLQNLAYQAAADSDEQAAFVNQMRTLMAGFDDAQDELYEQYQPNASDVAIAQVLATMDDTTARWEDTRVLLNQFMQSDNAADRTAQLDAIGESIVTTNIYANRTSESFQAVAERQQQNVFWTAVIVGVLTLLTTGLIVSLLIDVVREMNGLTSTAHALAGGTYTLRANTHGLSEIATVGETFNLMADSIQQREADLREANEMLEQRVHDRTLSLEKATAEAQEASRLKSEFLANMSHELRTPLNAILLFTESMMAGMLGEVNEKQHEKLTRVQLNSKRLLNLINDLLDIAKIEAGRVEIIHEPFAVRDLATTLKAQTESLAEVNSLDYRLHIDPTLPEMLIGDAARIEQIAKNLISNACKFTKEGTVDLSFSVAGATSWEMAVKDTGIGIPPHALDFIFDEFRQVDGSSQRAYGGTGLGLAICRNLTRMMDGDIRVISTPGKGSTFTVRFPLIVSETKHNKELSLS